MNSGQKTTRKFAKDKLRLPKVNSDKFKLILDPFKQVPPMRRLKKSELKKNFQKLSERSNKEKDSTKDTVTEEIDLYDAITSLHRVAEEGRKDSDYAPISRAIRKILQKKFALDLEDDRVNEILESIAKSVTTKVVFKNELLFSLGSEITGVFILLDGKIGLGPQDSNSIEKQKLRDEDLEVNYEKF